MNGAIPYFFQLSTFETAETFMRFSVKLSILFSFLTLLTGAVIAYIVHVTNTAVLEAHIKDRLENQAFHTLDKIDRTLFERYSDVKTMAGDPVVSSKISSPEEITDRLNALRESYRSYASISFFDADRVMIADSSGADIGKQHPPGTYWEELGPKDYVTGIYRSVTLKKTAIHFVHSVKDSRGALIGYIVARMPVEGLYEIVKQSVGIYDAGKDFSFELLDGKGHILYSDGNSDGLKSVSLDWEAISGMISRGKAQGSIRHGTGRGAGGEEILAFQTERGFQDYKGNGWLFKLSVPSSVAFASANTFRNQIMMLFFGIAALSVISVLALSRKISKTIEDLGHASNEIARGNLDVAVETRLKDEIGTLAKSFNKMASDLKHYRGRLMASNLELEATVAERTAELRAAIDMVASSEQKYRSLVENVPAITYLRRSGDGKLLYISPQIETLIGYTPKEWLANGNLWLERLHPGDRDGMSCVIDAAASGGSPYSSEYRFIKKDGGVVWVHDQLSVIRDSSGAPAFLQGIALDVTERKGLEEELQRSEKRYKSIFNAASVSLWEEDVTAFRKAVRRLKEAGVNDLRKYMEDNPGFVGEAIGMIKVVDVNEATVRLFKAVSKQELLGSLEKVFMEESIPAFRDLLLAVIDGRGCFETQSECRTLSGDRMKMLLSATMPPGEYKTLLVSIFDITRIKQAEEELGKARRLESIGILAGGIAHDFNNILTAILGNITFSKVFVEPGSKIFERLSHAEAACGKAKELSNNIITFAQGGSPLRKRLHLENLLRDTVRALLAGTGVKADLMLPDNLDCVDADESQLRQVMTNIVENAIEAMPGGGTLRVMAEDLLVGIKDNIPLSEGKYIKISIQDTGCGISQENLPRIFEPYFTTKEMEGRKGMGLGLAICHSIIKRHGGFISAESSEGKGTIISISLPYS